MQLCGYEKKYDVFFSAFTYGNIIHKISRNENGTTPIYYLYPNWNPTKYCSIGGEKIKTSSAVFWDLPQNIA